MNGKNNFLPLLVALVAMSLVCLKLLVPRLICTQLFSANMRSPGEGLLGLITTNIMKSANKRSSEDAWKRLNIQSGENIVELGAGNGHGVMFASKFAPKRIIAVEISPRFVELLKGTMESYQPIPLHQLSTFLFHARNIPQMDIYNLDAKDLSSVVKSNSVDKLMAMNVVYFLHPLEKYAKEMKRILKRGKGHAILGYKDVSFDGNPDIFINKNVTTIRKTFEKVGFKVTEEQIDMRGAYIENYLALHLRH